MSQFPSKQASWDLTQFSQLPPAALLYFPEFHQWSEISSLSKVILVLGKARSHRAPNVDYRRPEPPGCFDVLPKISAQGVAHSCRLLSHQNSFHGVMFKLNAQLDADLLLYSLSCFECDGHTVFMLTQWCLLSLLTSTVRSSFMHTPSRPLSWAARLH